MSHRRQTLVIAAISVAVCLPFFHYVAWLGDEGILLHAARRMIRGEHIYRDFFEFMQPLGFLIAYGWFKLFGDGFFGVRVLAVATISISASVAFVASRRVSRAAWISGALIFAWLIGSQGNWTVVGHRWFTLAFSISALALLLSALERERDPVRVLVAGICVGAAVVTTAPPGGLIGIACLAALVWARRPLVEIAALALGSLLVPGLTAGWMAWDGVLGDATRTAFAFLAHRYAGVQSVPFGRDVDRQSYLLVAAFPLAGILLLQARAEIREPKVRAALCFALAGFASCFPRPDVAHIGFAVPLACPFLAWGISRLNLMAHLKLMARLKLVARLKLLPRRDLTPATKFRWERPFAALALLLLLAPTLDGYSGRVLDVGSYPAVAVGSHPMAKAVRFGSGTQPEELASLLAEIAALPPNDAIFFYPYEPMLIYLTGRRHAAAVELFTPNYTWPSQYRESCESAIRDAVWAVIDRPQAQTEGLKSSWPKIGDTNPPEKVAFERALEGTFLLVRRTPRYELRKRKPDATMEVCKAIPVEESAIGGGS